MFTFLSAFIIALTAYVSYVRYRHKKVEKKLNSSSSSPLNLDEAYALTRDFHYLHFPFLATKALEFGLFKTYGIPSISSILFKTRQLIDVTNHRYDDTDIIIREITEHAPSSKRYKAALERMNFIHSQYTISNRDYLYVLSVFIVEPIDMVIKYGHRLPLEKEKEAVYLTWKHIGEQMGIKNIPGSYEEVDQFLHRYEDKYMKYAESNDEIAHATMELLLSKVPRPLLGIKLPQFLFTQNAQSVEEEGLTATTAATTGTTTPSSVSIFHAIVIAFSPSHVSKAMGFPEVHPSLFSMIDSLLRFRSFFILYFCPPHRKYVLRLSETDEEYEKSVDEPLFTKFDQYEKTYKNGYRIHELGPSYIASSCPFGMSTKKREYGSIGKN